MTDSEEGFLLGILVGEGHFGGYGRAGMVSVRMHVKALREVMVPFLRRHLDKVDSHIRERIGNMFERYHL